MKCLALCYKGTEDIVLNEIDELISSKGVAKEGCVIFDTSMDKLAYFCYKAQSVNRVMILLDSFKINSAEDLKRVSSIDFSKFLDKHTFAARALICESELNKAEVESTAGEFIEGKVNLKNPDVTVLVYVYSSDCYVGIDFSGDLSIRDYKIFTNRTDIKGSVAYALVRLSGYDGKGIFLNPFCSNGTMLIEAGLYGAGKSVHFFNKNKFAFLKFFSIDISKFDNTEKEVKISGFDKEFGNTRAAKGNSKIAGVKADISMNHVDWIETKFDKVDFIACCLPKYSKVSNPTIQIKELFKQAKNVLKSGLAVGTNDIEKVVSIALSEGFKLVSKREIKQGGEGIFVAVFKK